MLSLYVDNKHFKYSLKIAGVTNWAHQVICMLKEFMSVLFSNAWVGYLHNQVWISTRNSEKDSSEHNMYTSSGDSKGLLSTIE